MKVFVVYVAYTNVDDEYPDAIYSSVEKAEEHITRNEMPGEIWSIKEVTVDSGDMW